jgi:hypothetical protein
MDRRYGGVRTEIDGSADEKSGLIPNKAKFPRIRQYIVPLLFCSLFFLAFKYGSMLVEDCISIGIEDVAHGTNETTQAVNIQHSESGNAWDEKILELVNPTCIPGPLNSIRYNNTVRTAITTYPRSGSLHPNPDRESNRFLTLLHLLRQTFQ